MKQRGWTIRILLCQSDTVKQILGSTVNVKKTINKAQLTIKYYWCNIFIGNRYNPCKMDEEKLEKANIEIENLKERIEELILENQILKEE